MQTENIKIKSYMTLDKYDVIVTLYDEIIYKIKLF